MKNNIIEIISLYTKLYHRAYTYESLASGLPTEFGKEVSFYTDDPNSLFVKIASRANLEAKLIKQDIQNFSVLHLPVILLLKDQKAAILEQFNNDKSKVKISIIIDNEPYEKWIDTSELEKEYLGFGYLLKRKFDFDKGHNTLKLDSNHWFWDSIKLSIPIYKDVLIASFLINLFVLATPLFTMNIYDRVIPNNSLETLYVFTIGVVLVYIIDMSLKYIRAYFLETASKKSDIVISSILFEKVMKIKMSHFPPSVGSFANNLKDFDMLRNFLANTTLTALIDLPFMIIFLIVIYYLGGSIVLIPIFTIILMLIFAFVIKTPLQKSIEEVHKVSSLKSSILVEALQNIETIKTLGMSGHVQYAWEDSVAQMAKKSFASKKLSNLIPNITGFLIQLNTIMVVFYGVFLIKDFELTQGGLIATVILTSRIVAPLGQAVALITSYEDAKTSYNILNDIMKLEDERPLNKKFIQKESFDGSIEFKNVSFSYPNSNVKVLDNISFKIEKNEKVAIIGKIGSGKSTIEKLILKLYEPTSGTILIDGLDINQLDPTWLRSHIGYVSQEVTLFRGTIKENIIYKSSNATDEQMLRATKISGADEFINRHPLGYDMPIGERGAGLSGGQKQAVAIARAFLKPYPIMLFDEPSNAMDLQTENKLINSLSKNLQNQTVIIITQKMSMLNIVDRIIVLDNGKIILDGKKEQVLKVLSSNER